MRASEQLPPQGPPAAVEQNVDAVFALQSEEQRALERALAALTTPAFPYGTALAMALWIGLNVGVLASGREPLDRPPFGWLDTAISVVALLLASLIAITQSRQGRFGPAKPSP